METLRLMFEIGLDIMKQEVTIWGYTVSLWNIYVYSAVVGVVAWAVWRFILHD